MENLVVMHQNMKEFIGCEYFCEALCTQELGCILQLSFSCPICRKPHHLNNLSPLAGMLSKNPLHFSFSKNGHKPFTSIDIYCVTREQSPYTELVGINQNSAVCFLAGHGPQSLR